MSQPGDLWVLGDHRVLCADATTLSACARVLAGSPADLVFTDPPYNVDYSQPSVRPGRAGRKIANDNLGVAFEQFLSDACRTMLEVSHGAIRLAAQIHSS